MGRKMPELETYLSEDNILRMLSPSLTDVALRCNVDYLHWDEVRYRDLGGFDPELVWVRMKMLRSHTSHHIRIFGCDFSFNVLDRFQEQLHNIDMMASAEAISEKITDTRRRSTFAVSSLMEESIASSQMEGAVTTTKVAKKMLRENSVPKDRSEQMIMNNYRAMGFIKEHLDADLTEELILDLHRIVTEGTMEIRYVGEFRDDDSIAVTDRITGKIYHQPPVGRDVKRFIKELCDFINVDEPFIHPVIKGVILHFLLAYLHPFVDGNGRVSRALFYWYCMKKDYKLMEYLTVSRIITKHKGRYDRSYVFTESDGNDLTYFIKYNLDVLVESIGVFTDYLDRKLSESEIADFSGYGFNRRQMELARDFAFGSVLSVYEIESKYQVSIATARNDVKALLDAELISVESREGNKILYRYSRKP